MINKMILAALVAATWSIGANAANSSPGQMVPSGKRCASIGGYCSFSGKMAVHISGCKSIDRYNGGCASSKTVVANGGISCSLANFGLKAPLPDVGPNACYVETLAEAGITAGATKAASRAPRPSSLTGAKCTSAGMATLEATIVVNKGVYDGQCKTFTAGNALKGNGSTVPDKPLFRVENGATLKNVIVGDGAFGDENIHVYNGAVLENIRWTKFRERAVTVKSAGNISATAISAANGTDRLFQLDAPTTLNLSNCVVDKVSKLVNQASGSNFKVTVFVDRCDISNVADALFVTDNSGSTAKITNGFLRKVDTACKGPWLACADVNNIYE